MKGETIRRKRERARSVSDVYSVYASRAHQKVHRTRVSVTIPRYEIARDVLMCAIKIARVGIVSQSVESSPHGEDEAASRTIRFTSTVVRRM